METLIVKQIDFKYNELGTCEHNELRRDMSCYRGEELGQMVLANLDKYVVVAEVQGEKLEDAYRLTNSIETSWYENEDPIIDVKVTEGTRSTSIGDIIEKDGVMFMVDSYGYLNLDELLGRTI